MVMALVTKDVVNSCQRRAVFSIRLQLKVFNQLAIYTRVLKNEFKKEVGIDIESIDL